MVDTRIFQFSLCNFCSNRKRNLPYADKEKFRHNLTRSNNRDLTIRTMKIVQVLNISDQACGINEIKIIENYLKNYQIMVTFFKLIKIVKLMT